MKIFGAKYNLPTNDHFSLSRELDELQTFLQRSAKSETVEDEQSLHEFYDNVFSYLSRILKWINTNALLLEKQQNQQVSGIQQTLEVQNKKLDKLLEKAALLKKENKELKLLVRKLSKDLVPLAHQLLGLSERASMEEIKAAFRAKARLSHPDQQGDPDHFLSVKLAFELLKEQQKVNDG